MPQRGAKPSLPKWQVSIGTLVKGLLPKMFPLVNCNIQKYTPKGGKTILTKVAKPIAKFSQFTKVASTPFDICHFGKDGFAPFQGIFLNVTIY